MPNEMELVPESDYIKDESVGLEYIKKFIEYCKENGIEPVIINIPYPASKENQLWANAAIRMAEDMEVTAINMQYDNVVEFDTDCHDSASHLNTSGARKVTDFLGRVLSEKFELEDKRYVADVYTELYGQLLGESPKLQNEKNNDGSGFIEKEKILPVHSLEERVWRAWEQIQKGLSKKKELGGELKRVLEQNGNNQDISLFMEKLDQKIWKRTNQPWKKLYKELNPGYTSNAEKQKRPLKKKSDKASFGMGQNGIFDFPDIECLHHFSSVERKRLKDNWNYTAKKGYMTDEHISFFINLCKKEGRGDSDHKELKDVFTDDVAQKVLKALKNRK